jgi:predicted deacylase
MHTARKPSRLQASVDLSAPGRHTGDLMLKYSDNSCPLGYHPIPVVSIKGRDGPVVLITGGSHGDEFEGPAAIMRLAGRLSPADLLGQIILMPALNAPAVSASARVSPLDGANLNRAFPGDADGGPTAMIADYIEGLLLCCDGAIDLHSGGKASFFAPSALARQTADPGLRAQNLALARAFGLPLIWELGGQNDDRTFNAAAERAGIPMIATELGGGGGVDPAITDAAEAGLIRALTHLGALPGTTELANPRRVEIRSHSHTLHAPADGIFDRAISAGSDVRAGDLAGQFHFVLEPERASKPVVFPSDGFVLAHTARGFVKRGDLLALVAQDVPDEQV